MAVLNRKFSDYPLSAKQWQTPSASVYNGVSDVFCEAFALEPLYLVERLVRLFTVAMFYDFLQMILETDCSYHRNSEKDTISRQKWEGAAYSKITSAAHCSTSYSSTRAVPQ